VEYTCATGRNSVNACYIIMSCLSGSRDVQVQRVQLEGGVPVVLLASYAAVQIQQVPLPLHPA
jgi:hypothetical protein